MDPRFLDHFEHPRNVGDLPDASGKAEVDNPVCGDRVAFALRLEGGRVAEVRYRVLGCSGAIAAASAASELAQGRERSAVLALEPEAVEAALGGMPPLKRHGADLAVDGLRAALAACGELERGT